MCFLAHERGIQVGVQHAIQQDFTGLIRNHVLNTIERGSKAINNVNDTGLLVHLIKQPYLIAGFGHTLGEDGGVDPGKAAMFSRDVLQDSRLGFGCIRIDGD